MFYVRSNDGTRIAVYEFNKGCPKTVFLVHGWPLSHKIYEYQIELRLSYAKELLKYTDLPVNEIAERCGINQASHFINLFKSREHITPLQFRKSWKP